MATAELDRWASNEWPRDEIVDNDYDLSINRYKEVIYDAVEYDPPAVILERLARLDAVGGVHRYRPAKASTSITGIRGKSL